MKARMNKISAIVFAILICAAPFASADVGWARIQRPGDATYVEKAKSWFKSTLQSFVGKSAAQPIVYTTPSSTSNQASAATTSRAPGSAATETNSQTTA